ncbi:hypothetical protein Tco_1560526, partial [Tanacetum coccineum]
INKRCGKDEREEIKAMTLSSVRVAGIKDGKGGGYLVFLMGGRISQNSIDRKRCGCQDKKTMENQHGVNIMAFEVQIGWLWTWPGKRL